MFKTRLLVIILLFQISLVHSEVYKWIDEDGKTVYGDKPVSENAHKIDIKRKPTEDKKHKERYKKQQKLLDVMQEERDEKIASTKAEKEKKEEQKQQCAKIRKELKETKEASAIYKETDDPNNPKIYSDEERKAEEDKYENYIKENC